MTLQIESKERGVKNSLVTLPSTGVTSPLAISHIHHIQMKINKKTQSVISPIARSIAQPKVAKPTAKDVKTVVKAVEKATKAKADKVSIRPLTWTDDVLEGLTAFPYSVRHGDKLIVADGEIPATHRKLKVGDLVVTKYGALVAQHGAARFAAPSDKVLSLEKALPVTVRATYAGKPNVLCRFSARGVYGVAMVPSGKLPYSPAELAYDEAKTVGAKSGKFVQMKRFLAIDAKIAKK